LSTRQLINDLVCNIFGANFNSVSALAIHQSSAWPQIINSREGWF